MVKPMREALKEHWPEYLMEAGGLGSFMVSACAFGVLLEHPGSPLRQAIQEPALRRLLMGLAMGLTAIGLIYSPWGKRSGAHFNPTVTATFLRLGKVAWWDGIFYILAQFAGGVAGVECAAIFLGAALGHPAVHYVATIPGRQGTVVAFVAESGISFGLMSTVLLASNTERLARFTGVFAGGLVAIYITFEAPISGMSMNPARSFGSAAASDMWTALWIYFTAPLLGMLLAAEAYVRTFGNCNVRCAKLHHQNNARCIFRCGFQHPATRADARAPESGGAHVAAKPV